MNTIPGMPCINHHQYDIEGIRVERFTTAPKDARERPPLICVHGGCHASWSWQEHAAVYAGAGYEVHALNWRGRGGSAAVDDDAFVNMSIADVVDDIDKVARYFDTPPVLIAHSMGGLAAQLYASAHKVGALVLLTPVVPSNVGATPIDLPIGDMDAPWGPPPPDVARKSFFQGLDDVQAAHFNALLVPESPLRVYEATRWSLAVDVTKLTAPILIVSGALDILTPPETGAALAALYGATYQLEPADGHNVLLGEGARRISEDVIAWVAGSLSRSDAHMTAEERMKVMNYLEESGKEFLAAIDGVTEEQWKWKSAPERWSVGETAEHIVLAEALLFGNVQKAIASQPNPAWEEKTRGKTEFIEKVMAPRLGKATVPEPIVHGGKMIQAQVRETFLKQRVEIEKFAAETQVALKEYTVEHPFTVFNTLNAYQWLIYAPLHTERHDKQIAEVKATQGYPKIVSNP